jgi:hypothetical protein
VARRALYRFCHEDWDFAARALLVLLIRRECGDAQRPKASAFRFVADLAHPHLLELVAIADLHIRVGSQVVNPHRVLRCATIDPTRTYRVPSLTRISGVFRVAPDLLPTFVTMITGRPVSRRVCPSAPFVRS